MERAFGTEFHMTNDSHLFHHVTGENGGFRLYEGKMIHQFQHQGHRTEVLDRREKRARAALLGRQTDEGQPLDYQSYRLAFRDVARNTDARTAIMTMLPPNVYCNHPLPYAIVTLPPKQQPDYRCALFFARSCNSLRVSILCFGSGSRLT